MNYDTLTRAEQVALRTLRDGEWHKGARTAGDTTVLGVPASNLVRLGLVERRGESRGPNPNASGFEYRITDAGAHTISDAHERLG